MLANFTQRFAPRAATPTQIASGDVERLREIDRVGDAWAQHPKRNARINHHLMQHVRRQGLVGGDVLEIGAREHPRQRQFAAPDWTYSVLDIEPFEGEPMAGVTHLTGDLTSCSELASESFDVIVSVDVFEHIDRPWLAAAEITRLLRPGGLVYTSTLFAWRYHPVPIDYWRFTPSCLEFLFADLITRESAFDTVERRRDIRGHGRHDQVPVDALGGFRENWRVVHVGTKQL